MDDSDKGFSSSTPIKPSVMPTFPSPGGADENGLNYDMKNPKKPVTKHFMSPTISAASKHAVPRKKILAERNQDLKFSDTHHQNAPISNSKTSPLNLNSGRYSRSSSRLTPLNSSASESDDDDDNSFVANSSLKPYDPLTNYLSPRPKFLRFKPNRHREVFLHRENGVREGKCGSGCRRRRSASFDSQKAIVEEDSSVDALPPSSQVGSVKQDDEVNNSEEDDSDEEIEELEGKGLTLKGVLKFLLLFVILFLSTSYISSMNSPTPSPTLQAIRGLKFEYYKIQNHVFEAATVNILQGGSESFDIGEQMQLGSIPVNQRAKYGFEKEQMVEDDNRKLVETTQIFGEMAELQHGGVENFHHGEMEKTQEVFDVLDTEIAENEDVDQLKGPEIEESYGVYDQELKDTVEDDSDHLQEIEIADDTDCGDHELERKWENSTLAFSVSEKEVNVDSDSRDEKIGSIDGGVGSDVVENEMERIEDITMNSGDEIDFPEMTDSENMDSDIINPKAVIGGSIFFMIVASLCLVFHSRLKRNSMKSSLPLEEDSIHEPVIADKISPILFHVEEDQKIQNPKVESFVNPKSLVHSMEEESKGFYQFHTPRVELLAEFSVGETSSSLKSCGMKNKMMETIESNACVSQEKGGSLSKLVSEFSTMDSPSYGSFNAEKKIVKKEEGKDGDARKVVNTPVRRSSRIQNRSIMSP